jgi:ankyrin repeat protein
VAAGNLETVKLLILAGANPLVPNANGQTPLALAEESGNTEIANELANAAANWSSASQGGTTAVTGQ